MSRTTRLSKRRQLRSVCPYRDMKFSCLYSLQGGSPSIYCMVFTLIKPTSSKLGLVQCVCFRQKCSAQVRRALQGSTLSALINNAGVAVPGPLMFQPMEDFKKIVNVNLFGTLSVIQVSKMPSCYMQTDAGQSRPPCIPAHWLLSLLAIAYAPHLDMTMLVLSCAILSGISHASISCGKNEHFGGTWTAWSALRHACTHVHGLSMSVTCPGISAAFGGGPQPCGTAWAHHQCVVCWWEVRGSVHGRICSL